MTQNRKRSRNVHEDEVEFMPLSKRINNLHINNGLFLDNINPMGIDTEWGPGPPDIQLTTASSSSSSSAASTPQINLPDTPPSSVQSLDWSLPQYSPDLSEDQNPHYFNINKLLFEMYLERLQRGCS